MILSGQFSYSFRKSSLFRFVCVCAVVSLICLFFFFVSVRMRRTPIIENLKPPIGSPGDIVIITGKNFGATRNASYVEFGKSRLTASSYISWSDTEIKVVLPANVQDGLVVVGTDRVRSAPAFFANERDIPVAVMPTTQTAGPVVTAVSQNSLYIGDLLIISGSNFGSTRENSAVYFTTEREAVSSRTPVASNAGAASAMRVQYIPANRNDFDYEFWSDTEIRVRIPDGAATGTIYVETPSGRSTLQKLTIESRGGTKTFGSLRTYLLQLAADVTDVVVAEPTAIRFYFPRPVVTAAQPSVVLTECIPEPAVADYQNTIIHQLQASKSMLPQKYRFSQNFVVSVYEMHTSVNPQLVRPYADMSEMLYAAATRPDSFIPAADKAVIALARQIVGNVANPYNKARLIYNYMIDNYRLNESNGATRVPLDMIRRKRGDAYDFAIIYTALLRASGIPAFTDSGVLVDRDMGTRNHWWCEFYLNGIGWIPVDVALGAGLSYQSWVNRENAREYYFGNLDSQHVTLSRGVHEIKPGSANMVQRPHAYALQTVWEESSHDALKYSSFWADPIVLGVY